jgi:hypothetical protein
VVGGFLMHIDFAKVDWGDFTSGANALFSLAASVTAAIASVFAKRLLCNNSDIRNHELQDRLSIQASQVLTWPVATVGSLGVDPYVQSYAFAGVSARIRNGSDQPIYGVKSQFFYEQVSVFNHQIGIVPPRSTIEELPPSELLSRLSANQLNFDIPLNSWDAEKYSIIESAKFALGIKFVDCNQIRWFRNPAGVLNHLAN